MTYNYQRDGSDHIVEFVSAGPKTYAYRTMRGKSQVKCKGITLNALNSKVVTFDSLVQLVRAFVENPNRPAEVVNTKTQTITRDKKTLTLKNATVTKRLSVVYTKRRVLSDFSTLPYGY